MAVAIVVAALNLEGMWAGKELTCQSGRDGKKVLSLQFTARLHKLLMLTSLSHVLFSVTIGQLVFGDGLPFATVRAGLRLSSYFLSQVRQISCECIPTFLSNVLVLPVIIMFTCHGHGWAFFRWMH